jgi:uncharacterized membrane protein
MDMKFEIVLFITMALITVYGYWFAATRVSHQGGITLRDEAFSITVPTSNTVKQGADATVTVLLNRGASFKRDVLLDIKTEGIRVIPARVLVRADDKPDVKLQSLVARDAAPGEYRVSVKATPETGRPTSTEFTVKVVAQ